MISCSECKTGNIGLVLVGDQHICPDCAVKKMERLKRLDVKIIELAQWMERQAVGLECEAKRIREVVRQPTDAEDFCQIRAQVYTTCVKKLRSIQ